MCRSGPCSKAAEIHGRADFWQAGGKWRGLDFKQRTEGHKKEIESAFVSDENKIELSAWVDNSTKEKSGSSAIEWDIAS